MLPVGGDQPATVGRVPERPVTFWVGIGMQYRATTGATGVGWNMGSPHCRNRHNRWAAGRRYRESSPWTVRPRSGVKDHGHEEPGNLQVTSGQPATGARGQNPPLATPASEDTPVMGWLVSLFRSLLPFVDPERAAWREDMERQYEASRRTNIVERSYLHRRTRP